MHTGDAAVRERTFQANAAAMKTYGNASAGTGTPMHCLERWSMEHRASRRSPSATTREPANETLARKSRTKEALDYGERLGKISL